MFKLAVMPSMDANPGVDKACESSLAYAALTRALVRSTTPKVFCDVGGAREVQILLGFVAPAEKTGNQ